MYCPKHMCRGMFYSAGLFEPMGAINEYGNYFVLLGIYFAMKMCKIVFATHVLLVPTEKVKETIACVVVVILSQLIAKEEVDAYAIG